MGLNHTRIAESMGVSRPTVITVLQKAAESGISHQTATGLSNRELAEMLYPQSAGPAYKMPDCAQIHREMAKSGVTLQLLWFEYCDRCRDAGEIPYQLTQFKKHYRDFVVKTKATMHIERKPGETTEVDWAGQTAGVVTRMTSWSRGCRTVLALPRCLTTPP
jgi:transposase